MSNALRLRRMLDALRGSKSGAVCLYTRSGAEDSLWVLSTRRTRNQKTIGSKTLGNPSQVQAWNIQRHGHTVFTSRSTSPVPNRASHIASHSPNTTNMSQYPPQNSYGQQQYAPPQPGYGYPPPQPQPIYIQAPPPQQAPEKERGCLYGCLATLCCCWVCGETCECCLECLTFCC
ncbi:hypothetical protein PZA11_002520 [Diplocarpon coronariae]